MKNRLKLLFLALLPVACTPTPADWQGTPNPLDTPAIEETPPEAMGRFGPHSEYFFHE